MMNVNKIATLKDAVGNTVAEILGPPNALSNSDALSEGLYALSETLIRGFDAADAHGGLGGRFGYGTKYENDVFMMHPFCWCEGEDCLWCGGSSCQGAIEHETHRSGCYQERLDDLQKKFGVKEVYDDGEYYQVRYGSPNEKLYNKAKRELCRELKQDYESGNEMHCTCGVNDEWRTRYNACECDWHLGRGVFRFGPATDAPNFWHKASGFQVRWYKWIGRDMEVSNERLTYGEWANVFKSCLESIPQEARDKAIADSEADAKREADPEYQEQEQARFRAMWEVMGNLNLDDAP